MTITNDLDALEWLLTEAATEMGLYLSTQDKRHYERNVTFTTIADVIIAVKEYESELHDKETELSFREEAIEIREKNLAGKAEKSNA